MEQQDSGSSWRIGDYGDYDDYDGAEGATTQLGGGDSYGADWSGGPF